MQGDQLVNHCSSSTNMTGSGPGNSDRKPLIWLVKEVKEVPCFTRGDQFHSDSGMHKSLAVKFVDISFMVLHGSLKILLVLNYVTSLFLPG